MATYVVLIYGDEVTWDSWSEEEDRRNGEAHAAFHAVAGSAIKGAYEVARPGKARSVRAGADGTAEVTDGPMVTAEVVLGGFYLLAADDLDAAVALAAQLPEATAPGSGVEVRPLVEGS